MDNFNKKGNGQTVKDSFDNTLKTAKRSQMLNQTDNGENLCKFFLLISHLKRISEETFAIYEWEQLLPKNSTKKYKNT